jgi:hypothetical protein
MLVYFKNNYKLVHVSWLLYQIMCCRFAWMMHGVLKTLEVNLKLEVNLGSAMILCCSRG